MALTPDEEIEYQRLRRQAEMEGYAAAGAAHLQQIDERREAIRAARPKPAPKESFSLYRMTVGGLRDTIQGAMDVIQDVGEWAGDKLGTRGVAARLGARRPVDLSIPQLKGSENAGTAESIGRAFVGFAVPFTGAAKAVGVARSATWLGRAGKAMLAGGLVDFANVAPVENNIAQTLKDTFGLDNAALDALTSDIEDGEDPDDWAADDRLVARLKSAAANAPLGLLTDAAFEAGAKGLRAYKAWRGTAEEAQAITAAVKTDLRIRRAVGRGADVLRPANDGDVLIREKGQAIEPRRPGRGDEVGRLPQAANDGAPVSPPRAANDLADLSIETVPAAGSPRTLTDVLSYLKAKAPLDPPVTGTLGDIGREGAFNRRAMFDDPENALVRLGYDPLKLDFSVYDDPHAYANLVEGLTELFEPVAAQLGRTGRVVSEAAIIKGARAVASRPEILRELHQGTAGLAERLTGARLLIGSHAHKLLALAKEAKGEIAGGAAGAKWDEFLEALHRHAYYIGEVRGASTETARALRSLQIIGKVRKTRAGVAKAAVEGQPNSAADTLKADLDAYTAEVRSFADDADRLRLIEDIEKSGGDLTDLARAVRRSNMTSGQRIGSAVRETIGNLFAPATAVMNIASGFTQLGGRGLAKALAGVGRMALSPLGRGNALAARVHFMQSHAYFHGILTGFGSGFREAISVLEKEGWDELALNVDGLGLHKLARGLRAKSTDAENALATGNYERTEVKNFRAISLSPAEQADLIDKIDKTDGPSFFTDATRGFLATVAPALNAAGSLSRLQTTLFINMPDQFVGVLAARAGKHAQAVELAAAEAAEAELEGKALTEYLRARSVELSDGEAACCFGDPFDAGAQLALDTAGEAEARSVLFQDELEFDVSKWMSRGLSSSAALNIFVPFVRTPLRILEQTALDYTPLGLLKGRIRKAILTGGPEADEARARLALGITAVMVAYSLADDRTIIGSDGSYRSSARLDRPSYTLRIGGDDVEFSRLDPLGTLLGFGADLRAYMDQAEGDPEAADGAKLIYEASVWAVTQNVLSKTWLTSIRQLVDLAGLTNDDSLTQRLDKMGAALTTRLVPASGIQRQFERWDDGAVREAQGFFEGLQRASVGADKLPVKRDPLGRPISVDGGERLLGVRVGPHSGADDPVAEEFEQLSFDLPQPPKTVEGVKLSSAQFSRYLELRGQIVRGDSGLTMEEALTELVGLPEYRELPRAGRVEAIRETMRPYARLATDALLKEDKAFAYRALRKEVFDDALRTGAATKQRDDDLARFAQELGLTPAQ